MHILRLTIGVALFAFTLAATAPSLVQSYSVSGDDAYSIGLAAPATRIVYDGVERLQVEHVGGTDRFSADVMYFRSSSGGRSAGKARFVQELIRGGSLEDRTDQDPDYLTVLNQPFAVRLDDATLHDLRGLHARVPFSLVSPMTGGLLQGYLQRGVDGSVAGQRVIGVVFDADGNMRGGLPDHPTYSITGRISMHGTAYYALRGALLLALNADLTIDGTLRDRAQTSPVHIVYRRFIRANSSMRAWSQAQI
jgi:hypothetical protein